MKILFDSIPWSNSKTKRGLLVYRDGEHYLSDDLVKWFITHATKQTWSEISWHPRANLDESTVDYWIDIPDHDLALLFKLTWGGNL